MHINVPLSPELCRAHPLNDANGDLKTVGCQFTASSAVKIIRLNGCRRQRIPVTKGSSILIMRLFFLTQTAESLNYYTTIEIFIFKQPYCN